MSEKKLIMGNEEWFEHIKSDNSTDSQRMFSSESYYYSFWKFADHGIVTIDERGIVIEANDSFCDLIGSDPIEVKGRAIKDFVCDSNYRDDYKVVESMVRGAKYSVEKEERFRYKFSDSTPYIPVKIVATRIPSSVSKPFRHVVIHVYDMRSKHFNWENVDDVSNKSWNTIFKELIVNHFNVFVSLITIIILFLALNGHLGDTVDKLMDKHQAPVQKIEKPVSNE